MFFPTLKKMELNSHNPYLFALIDSRIKYLAQFHADSSEIATCKVTSPTAFHSLYNSQEISSINTNKNHINSDPGWRSQVSMAQATYGSRSNKDGRYIRHWGYCISDVTEYRLLSMLRHFWSTSILPYRHCEKVDKGRWSIWNVGTSVPIRGRLSKKPMNFVATASNMYRLACLICQRSYQCSKSYPECQIEAAIYRVSCCSSVLALKCSSIRAHTEVNDTICSFVKVFLQILVQSNYPQKPGVALIEKYVLHGT